MYEEEKPYTHYEIFISFPGPWHTGRVCTLSQAHRKFTPFWSSQKTWSDFQLRGQCFICLSSLPRSFMTSCWDGNKEPDGVRLGRVSEDKGHPPVTSKEYCSKEKETLLTWMTSTSLKAAWSCGCSLCRLSTRVRIYQSCVEIKWQENTQRWEKGRNGHHGKFRLSRQTRMAIKPNINSLLFLHNSLK